jgi:hypothetical protein
MDATNNLCMGTGCAPGGEPSCRIPGQLGTAGRDMVGVAVDPQLVDRSANDTVYCSCRCDGPDPNATYCECPSGFACVELVENIGLGGGNLPGSYCIKEGTRFEQSQSGGTRCDPSLSADDGSLGNCGNNGQNP